MPLSLGSLARKPLIAALAAGLVLAIVPAAAEATSSDQAVAYQLDPAHDGYQTDDPITAPLSQAWSDTLPGAVSYPLVVNGVVYVTASVASGYGTTLYAIEQATGATLWTHALGGTYNFSGLAYDAGQIFTINFGGQLTAFNASTGATDWVLALSGQTAFSSAPTAANGYVYVAGAGTGGTVYAVSESTGALAWTAPVENGDDSSPAVSATGVYVTYACDQDYDFNPVTGALIWHFSGNCDGGGGKTPVLAGGDIFARDNGSSGDVVLSASGGTDVGSFESPYAPAAGGGELYSASGGSLVAFAEWGLGSTEWSFSGDSHLDTAPLVDGSLAFEGSSSGELYAIDTSTGTSVWSTNTGSAIAAPDEEGSVLVTGLGVGENTLIVPAGKTLLAYTGANVGSGIPSNTVAPSVTGAPAANTALGADVGVWTALPGSYTYLWSLCDPTGGNCAPITTGGSGESYTPTAQEAGDTLELTVTAANGSGTSNASTSAPSSPIAPLAPANQTAPAISGTASVGQTLSASTGAWSSRPSGYAYQWLRCTGSCSAITGATASTYVVAAADAAARLEVQVTATNVTGSATSTSPQTALVPTPTTVTLTTSSTSILAGDSLTFEALVAPNVNGGTLTFAADGTVIPGCSAIAMSSLEGAKCTGSLDGSGQVTITATYSGDSSFAAASASLTQIVTAAPITTPPPAVIETPPAASETPVPAASAAPTPVAVAIDTNPSARTTDPTIGYTETGSVTSTICTIDGLGTPCSSSSAKLSKLSSGHHTFQVKVSGAGSSATAEVLWVITKLPAASSAAKKPAKDSKPHAKHKKKKKKKKQTR
ncbi:MAG TPA: PQQ-binding-like beta-propeller repeat protein [Solirubrobacteraceae bacterium]|jgi:outer membrane protein assembly factor BamB